MRYAHILLLLLLLLLLILILIHLLLVLLILLVLVLAIETKSDRLRGGTLQEAIDSGGGPRNVAALQSVTA
jgi:hypothetical protein